MFGYESIIGVSALVGTKKSLNRAYLHPDCLATVSGGATLVRLEQMILRCSWQIMGTAGVGTILRHCIRDISNRDLETHSSATCLVGQFSDPAARRLKQRGPLIE
jgi:hypothetical protein